jgi:hypothetical protein
VLADAGLIGSPEPHVAEPEPFRPRELLRPSVIVPVAIGAGALLVGLIVGFVVWRRRRRDGSAPGASVDT